MKKNVEPFFTDVEMDWLMKHNAEENPVPRIPYDVFKRFRLNYDGLEMDVTSRQEKNGKTYSCIIYSDGVTSELTFGNTMQDAIQKQIDKLNKIKAKLMKALTTATSGLKELDLSQIEKDYNVTFVK